MELRFFIGVAMLIHGGSCESVESKVAQLLDLQWEDVWRNTNLTFLQNALWVHNN